MVTVIIPLLEGEIDEDCEVRVYQGALTKDQVIEETKEEAYEGQACLKTEGGYFITFTNDDENMPVENEDGSIYWDGRGDQTYEVRIVELENSRG